MKQRTPSYIQLLFLLFVLTMQTACQQEEDDNNGITEKVNVGDAIPDFILTDADGKTVSASSLSGQVYILSFFDTGCRDCQKEFPVLQQIYDKYKSDVVLLNVPRSQSANEISQYWQASGLSMPVYIPKDKDLYYKFASRGIPRCYIVDSKGVVQAVFTDAPIADYGTLDAILQDLLKDGAAQEDDTVKLSVRLRVPSAAGSTGIDFFQNEYIVSHLELFFFDSSTKKLVNKFVIEELSQDKEPYFTEYDITYLMKTLKIQVGVYNIFAVANYDKIPDNITSQDEFLELTDNVTYEEGIVPNMPQSGPVMTSRATSMLAVDLKPWSNKDFYLTIDVERVMAKVQIGTVQNYFELKHDGKKYADIHLTNYKLVNLNSEYYLFQHKAEMSALGGKPIFVMPQNFEEYNYGNREYVIDPLFYKKVALVADAEKFRNYYKSWYGAFTTDNFASIPASGNYGNAYILENTAFKSSQKNGFSPGIIFKAAVSPVSVYIYDTKTRTLVEETRQEYWSHTIYLYDYKFYGSIQAVNVAAGLSLDELATYTDVQLKAYGIKKCNFNMGVYETYYTYWIQHRTDNTDAMGAMCYGVVRNNFYRINITGVSGIGDSEIVPEIMRDNYSSSNINN